MASIDVNVESSADRVLAFKPLFLRSFAALAGCIKFNALSRRILQRVVYARRAGIANKKFPIVLV